MKLNEPTTDGKVIIEIPELKISKEFKVKGDSIAIAFEAKNLKLWSTKMPKLYDVNIKYNDNSLIDQIGFRTIKVEGEKILLNGNELFLRGICLHEEVIPEVRRAQKLF